MTSSSQLSLWSCHCFILSLTLNHKKETENLANPPHLKGEIKIDPLLEQELQKSGKTGFEIFLPINFVRKIRNMSLLPCCRLSKEQSKSIKEEISNSNRASSRLQSRRFSTLLKNLSRNTTSGKRKLIEDEVSKLGNINTKVQGLLFTYSELVDATDDFNHDRLVGEGGFGKVYKGYLKSIDQVVAIKQLDREGSQGTREFFSEVLMLSLVQHQNLVKLIGYCVDGDQRCLVYEYMPGGSLEDHLFNLSPEQEPLDWNTRMKIGLGAAQGLEHLHDVADPPIIYRDFKASNILLDSALAPKLADFGLAKLGPTGHMLHVSTRVMGTYGYCAPEYQLTGKLTTKSDVYSFGVVFLELIAGRRVIDTSKPSKEQNLINWAAPLLKDKAKFTAIADPLLDGKFRRKSLYQALAIAAMCLQEDAEARPSIADVVSALEFLAQPRPDDQ